MKTRPAVIGIVAAVILTLSFLSPASSMDEPEFSIKRMVVCEKIVDREPVAAGDIFPASLENVYCFFEAGAVENDTTVTFVWYFENKEMAKVSLPLTKGKRWRTYSSKKLAGQKGNWKVELLESSGIILHSVSFQVQ